MVGWCREAPATRWVRQRHAGAAAHLAALIVIATAGELPARTLPR